MMTDQPYNELFRDRMEDYSSPVSGRIWENIELKNKNSGNKKLFAAKYILLFFFLAVAVRTSDELITSDTHKNTASLYKINIRLHNADSITQADITHSQTNMNPQPAEQINTGYNSHVKKNRLRKIQGTDLEPLKQDEKNDITTNKLNENTGSSSPVFNEKTDSAVSNTAAIKKNQTKQHTEDSTADVTVETHENKDRLSLYIFASPDAVFSHVRAGNSSYQQQRNEEAKSLLSGSAGIRIRYNINAHWSGNIGIQYSLINERTTLPDITSHNHYKSLDVPLLASYRFYKNRFEMDANTGIVFNISTAYQGYISSINNQPLDVHKENIYRNNTSLSYYGGVQFLYRPANRITLFAEPYFKYQPQNIASSFQPFEEKIQKAGVLLGVRYRFNK